MLSLACWSACRKSVISHLLGLWEGDAPNTFVANACAHRRGRPRRPQALVTMGIGSVEMDNDEPGLFEIPDGRPPPAVERQQSGRNRETWARTATAEVTVIDAAAVLNAVARAEERAVTIWRQPDQHENAEDELPQAEAAKSANSTFDAVAGLIWPTDGLEELLEAGAFRLLGMDIEAEAGSVDRGTLTWTVTVKLGDVQELRRFAAQAHPGQAELIAASLPVAWDLAADPFVPLRSIPGITWQPGNVEVRHVLQRRARSPEATLSSRRPRFWRQA